jgi:hypothetical protein
VSVAASLCLLAAHVLSVAGCSAPPARSLLERAIEARGGPIPRIERASEATVYQGVPGHWRWRIAFEPPETMRFTLETSGEEQHWVTDGRAASTYFGDRLVASEPLAGSEPFTIVRWAALLHLDALRDPARFSVRELASHELPEGRASGLEVEAVAGPAARYRLFFDSALRPVEADGPLSIPAVGSGRAHALFSDFRRTGGRLLPFHASYTLDGEPLLEERVVDLRLDGPD